jgi:hypothetical protein
MDIADLLVISAFGHHMGGSAVIGKSPALLCADEGRRIGEWLPVPARKKKGADCARLSTISSAGGL